MFKRVCKAAGIGDSWTPRELRTSFVSLMSHRGVSIEEIARLAGHASTQTTEVVYRRELRPVITTGAEIMDELFGPGVDLRASQRSSTPATLRQEALVQQAPEGFEVAHLRHRGLADAEQADGHNASPGGARATTWSTACRRRRTIAVFPEWWAFAAWHCPGMRR